jgi:hypothetical protein
MHIELYLKDTMGQKHCIMRDLDESMIFDELDEIVNTFNLILSSCGYVEYVTIQNEESED